MVTDFVDGLVAQEAAGSEPVLRIFGGPRVICGTERLEVPEGSKRLLVFMALHRGQVERRYVAGLLWQAGTEDRAAGNLRSALWRLSQAQIEVISADRHHLALRDGVLVDVDVVTDWARRLIAGRPVSTDLAALPASTDAMDLLPGWYDDWVLIERERIRHRVLHALESMSRLLVAAGRCAEGVEAALVAVGAEPLRESAQRALLAAHLAEGNWIEARRSLDAYRELLGRELGFQPDPALAAMLNAHRRRVSEGGAALGEAHRITRPATVSMASA